MAGAGPGSRQSVPDSALRRALAVSPREIPTTFHVFALIVLVEVLVRTMRLPRLAGLLGCRLDLSPGAPDTRRMSPKELPEKARRQMTCTRRVADYWPFSKGPCLRRSLVAGHLLRDLDPAVRLGFTTWNGETYAHAWLEIDGRPLENVSAFLPFEQRSHADGAA